MAEKTKRPRTDTTLSLAPLGVDEALAALLCPPPAGDQSARKAVKQKTKRKAR